MKRSTKIIAIISGILLLLTAAVIFKGFRDLREIQNIAADFKPELLPGKSPETMKDEEKIFYAACLEQKFGAIQDSTKASEICACVGVNTAHYVWPLVPKEDMSAPARLVQLYKNAEEMAAKGAVIMSECSKLNPRAQ